MFYVESAITVISGEERDRQAGRQAGRLTDRQTDRQTDRRKQRDIDRESTASQGLPPDHTLYTERKQP